MAVLYMLRGESVDRIGQLIVCILDLLQGRSVGKFELTKHLYLVDVQAMRTLGRPLSGVTWQRFQNGPFSERITAARDSLREAGFLTVETPAKEHRLVPGAAERVAIGFDDLEYSVIHATVTKNLDMDSDALRKAAYETEPMLLVQEEERLSGEGLDRVELDMASVQRSVFAIES